MAITGLTPAEQQRLAELEESAEYVREVRSKPGVMAHLAQKERRRMPKMTGEEFRRKYLKK